MVVGIVTLVENGQLFIWTTGVVKEVVWNAKDGDAMIGLGNWVNFDYDERVGKVVRVEEIRPPLRTRLDNKQRVQIQTKIVFPPPHFENVDWRPIENLAWSLDFQRVGVYHTFATRQPDVVYEAWITRLPRIKGSEEIENEFGTIWCLPKQELVRVARAGDILKLTPWASLSARMRDVRDSSEDFQLISQENPPPSTVTFLRRDSSANVSQVPIGTTIAAHRESLQSGDMTDESFIGIVTVDVGTLRCAWSLSCGDFLIPPDPDVKLQAGDWVRCRVFESPDAGAGTPQWTAYSCEKHPQPLLSSTFLDGCLSVKTLVFWPDAINQRFGYGIGKSEQLGDIEVPSQAWEIGRRKGSPLECWVVKKQNLPSRCAWRFGTFIDQHNNSVEQNGIPSTPTSSSDPPDNCPTSTDETGDWLIDVQGLVVGAEDGRFRVFSRAGYGAIEAAHSDKRLVLGSWLRFAGRRRPAFDVDLIIEEYRITEPALPVTFNGGMLVVTSVRRGLLHDITSPELGMVIDENSLIPTLPGWYLVKVRRTRSEGKTGGFQWRVEAYYGEYVPGMPIKEPALGGTTGSVEDTSDGSDSIIGVEMAQILKGPERMKRKEERPLPEQPYYADSHANDSITTEQPFNSGNERRRNADVDAMHVIQNVKGIVMRMDSKGGEIYSRLTRDYSIVFAPHVCEAVKPGMWVEYDVRPCLDGQHGCAYEVLPGYEALARPETRTRVGNDSVVEVETLVVLRPDLVENGDNWCMAESADVGLVRIPRQMIDVMEQGSSTGGNAWRVWVRSEKRREEIVWFLSPASQLERTDQVLPKASSTAHPHVKNKEDLIYTSEDSDIDTEHEQRSRSRRSRVLETESREESRTKETAIDGDQWRKMMRVLLGDGQVRAVIETRQPNLLERIEQLLNTHESH